MTPNTLMELMGYAAAALTTASFLPQAVQTFRTRNTDGISLGMYGMLVTGVALWVVYGVAIGSIPMIAANAVTLVLASTILGLAAHARRETGPDASNPLTIPGDEPALIGGQTGIGRASVAARSER